MIIQIIQGYLTVTLAYGNQITQIHLEMLTQP